MVEQKTFTTNYVEVKNRNNGYTGYTLTSGICRQFNIGETKKIDIEELKELSQMEGGEYLLRNYLIINDQSALDFLNINPEPEYWYDEPEIRTLLESGTLDQLEDCLNFAPQGVIDMVKEIAVKTEVPDTRKRKLILEKTGFSVDNAINVNKVMNTEVEEEAPKTTERKAAPIATPSAPQRKSKYTVVTTKK